MSGNPREFPIETPKQFVVLLVLSFVAPMPAAQVVAGKADGKKVYESSCMSCHGTGVANAPKFGDKKAWTEHLMHGTGHLYDVALRGQGAMPPRGGNLTLSDAEVKAAVDYMLGAVK